MIKFNEKEKKVLSVTLGIWGVFLILSGIIMNAQVKPIINTNYSLSIQTKRVAETQAKVTEIKLKEIEIEVNNPIPQDVKDYLENKDELSDDIIKSLKLDTSLVNINEPGTYQYTVTYKKKKYLSTIKVKEKELPNVSLKLKTIKLKIGESLSTNPRSYIDGNVSDEVYNNLTLDLSGVNNQQQGTYTYYIIYKNTKYSGKIIIENPGPTIITPETQPDNPEPDPNPES